MKQWFALRTKPRKELSAAALLDRAGLEIFVPQVKMRQQRGKAEVPTVFFPGYFFGRLDPMQGEIQLARYTHGILHIVGYGDQPWPVPDDIVVAIRERLAQGHPARAGFRTGDRVVITGGPFRDVEAMFDSHLSASGRARVLIEILHRLCRAEVWIGQLRLSAKQRA